MDFVICIEGPREKRVSLDIWVGKGGGMGMGKWEIIPGKEGVHLEAIKWRLKIVFKWRNVTRHTR
jgi:hypothetical protein